MEEINSLFPRGAVEAIEKLLRDTCGENGSIMCTPVSGTGGSSGAQMQRITLVDSNSKECLSLVVKIIPNDERKTGISKAIGLAREALFFNEFAAEVNKMLGLPKLWYAEGDFATGEKVIVMEDLKDATQSGYFFGPGSPLNHGKNLEEICERAGNPHCKEVAAATFRAAAELHARYWEDESLLKLPWLRGSSWVQCTDEESWTRAQQTAVSFWNSFRLQRETGEAKVAWPEDVFAIVDASMGKVSWDSYVSARRPWTLVHGDFHPANMMWCHNSTPSSGDRQLIFLDWEMVGLGSGPQELGQYLISHMDPVCRKECEEELVRGYYDHLVSIFPESKACTYTWDECWSEYKIGGVGRWMWFLAYFAGSSLTNYTEYFIEQVGSFLRDHGITADTIEQPRS